MYLIANLSKGTRSRKQPIFSGGVAKRRLLSQVKNALRGPAYEDYEHIVIIETSFIVKTNLLFSCIYKFYS